MQTNMRVLGIDPGYGRLGIAVLEKTEGKESLLYSECLETSKDLDFKKRLSLISKKIKGVIKEFKPESLAIENLFFNKNQKTAMRVSETRGAIINICLSSGLEVYEFTPLQVKIAVTGYGRSGKKQVMDMVKSLIEVKRGVSVDDEFDAIAVGLTMIASEKSLRARKI